MPGFHFSSHSATHPMGHGIHYDEPSHLSGAKSEPPGEGGHIPREVKSESNPFTAATSGLFTESTPRKSTLQKVISPTKQGDYVVNTKDPADANGTRPVYLRDDDDIATPQPTQERAIADGKGGWKMVSDADAAKPASHPALSPAAKIDPKRLGSLNDKGVYPGGDGNSYVRVGDDHYQVSYDRSLKSWMVVDPNRPHDFSRSVPVKLDGKGSAEALPKAGLKGGSLPKTKAERIAEAQAAVNQTQAKKQTAYAAKQEALHKHQQIASEQLDTSRRAQEAARTRDDLIRQKKQWQQSLRREGDPVQREDLQGRLAQARLQIASVKQEIAVFDDKLRSIDERLSDAAADRLITSATYAQAWEDHFRAERRLTQAYQAAPRLGNLINLG
ncbi:hypothetical protein [Dyella nitratireducens]|uniref:Uncharacterized protein n=1 Tax=Dyella nitratireducens TaxID=1849580 RepID=A0ABQ1GTA2_9GAMM|nr:hypothetical protein [Dyella nitratireducens]GGA49648.1 hypothetical protein GCM10010981_43640 [Dyella nitratireducens]GLQ42479.1 hypothetical protein GCM10007902_23290 [Dyella nitratireducens]